MPTYKNVSSLKRNIGDKVIEPGDEIKSFVYFNENEVGLMKTNDAPFFNPIVLSEVIDREKEVVIPEKDKNGERLLKYAVHFYLEKGKVDLFYNSSENLPALKLYEGCRWNNRYFERKVEKLLVKGDGPFLLWIIVERIF